MSEDLDLSKITLDDVKIGGDNTPAPANDPAPAADPAPAVDPAPATDPVKDPAPAADPAPAKAEQKETKAEPATYNFKDDFIKNVVEFYEKTGDITPYLQAKLVDFNAMSDEDIMRRELREQYPEVSDKAFEKLFKQQVVDKYKLDAEVFEEDDTELGKELLKSEAAKLRAKYQEWQSGFKAPEPQPDNSAAEMQRMLQEFEQTVKENDLTKSLLNDKRIAIKTADGEFAFEVADPNALVDMTIDNNKFFEQFAAGEDKLDYDKWYKTVAYAQNPELLEKSLINYGKTLGREEITKELKNPSTAPVGDIPTESSGDFTTGLLNAFASRGISK